VDELRVKMGEKLMKKQVDRYNIQFEEGYWCYI